MYKKEFIYIKKAKEWGLLMEWERMKRDGKSKGKERENEEGKGKERAYEEDKTCR